MEKAEEGGIILTKAEAKKLVLVKDEDMIHTFLNNPMGLVGCDHPKESVFKDIESAEMLQLAGEQAQKFGHALAIMPHTPIKQSEILFMETDKKQVEKLNKKISKME